MKQVFVAYKFLDCDPADLETPVSLPKPAPDRPISFNFKKGKIKLQNTLTRPLKSYQKNVREHVHFRVGSKHIEPMWQFFYKQQSP